MIAEGLEWLAKIVNVKKKKRKRKYYAGSESHSPH
jgi:hypothetical protein